jgi:hypothetical protein
MEIEDRLTNTIRWKGLFFVLLFLGALTMGFVLDSLGDAVNLAERQQDALEQHEWTLETILRGCTATVAYNFTIPQPLALQLCSDQLQEWREVGVQVTAPRPPIGDIS